MTTAKAVVQSLPSGVDVRVVWEEENATDEEKALATELAVVLDEYLKIKEKKEAK